ncbi:MAG: YdbL family protein [Rhodospirillum sp.]|nr:YdbL family protein [Rhodospirillum sp.]MCF8502979.1 YdbL family protein [Rhodospirillum sp.]
MTRFSKVFGGLVLGASLTLAAVAPALAMSLDEARSQGLICEATDGLIRATGGGGDVQALVNSTNAQRMQVYQASASKEGVPVVQIQAVSGEQLRQKYKPCN